MHSFIITHANTQICTYIIRKTVSFSRLGQLHVHIYTPDVARRLVRIFPFWCWLVASEAHLQAIVPRRLTRMVRILKPHPTVELCADFIVSAAAARRSILVGGGAAWSLLFPKVIYLFQTFFQQKNLFYKDMHVQQLRHSDPKPVVCRFRLFLLNHILYCICLKILL